MTRQLRQKTHPSVVYVAGGRYIKIKWDDEAKTVHSDCFDGVFRLVGAMRNGSGKHARSGGIQTRPGTRVAGQAFGALVGGKTVDQVFRWKLIKKITLHHTESEDKAWWQFVGIFSKVFAEAARGQSFLVSAVPYIEKNDSISKGQNTQPSKKT